MTVFNVTFLSFPSGKHKQLTGAGTVEVLDDCIVLTRAEVPHFFSTEQQIVKEIPLDYIANVQLDSSGKTMTFCDYNSQNYSGTPVWQYQFKLETQSDATELLSLLPQRQSQEARLENDFKRRLYEKTPYAIVTNTMIGICILVYLLMGLAAGPDGMLNPTGQTLLSFGADFAPMVIIGQWSRMITCAFVHIGLMHIAFNLIVLWQAGQLVERLYGNVLFFILYIGSAISGSMLSLMMSPDTISAGASGAVFGVYGALLAYMMRHQSVPSHMVGNIVKGALFFIGFNLFYGMQPGIDNWCHVGGLLGGFVLGLIVAPPFESDNRKRHIYCMTVIGSFLVIACTTYFVQNKVPTIQAKDFDFGGYYTELGVAYTLGDSNSGIKKDINTAIKYYQKGIKYNNPLAIYNMGVLYRDGMGVEKDEQKALDLFKQAAELSYVNAQSEYGRLLCLKGDYANGIIWLEKACSKGDAESAYLLGYIYFNGDGVEKDVQKAIEYLKQSAEKDCADGMVYYAIALLSMQSEKPEPSQIVEAVDWLEKASVRNSPTAKWLLGGIYYKGDESIPQDKERGLALLKESAELGFEPAKDSLKKIDEGLDPFPEDE